MTSWGISSEVDMKSKKRTPEQAARVTIARLKKRADLEKAKQAQRYFKETIRSFGISAKEVREIAQDLYRSLKPDWGVAEAIQLCDLLFPRPELEAKGIAALLLAYFKKDFPKELFFKIKDWLSSNYLDNWASVDVFCPEVVGSLLDKYPELIDEIEGWAISSNRWVKRASLVSFLKLARKEKYRDIIFGISKSVFPFEDDLIQKANGWLLREVGKSDEKGLEEFLLSSGPSVPRTTLRYAIERFDEKKRKHILFKTKELWKRTKCPEI
jgi:3-methyladenine DNA glycosylase AlkD